MVHLLKKELGVYHFLKSRYKQDTKCRKTVGTLGICCRSSMLALERNLFVNIKFLLLESKSRLISFQYIQYQYVKHKMEILLYTAAKMPHLYMCFTRSACNDTIQPLGTYIDDQCEVELKEYKIFHGVLCTLASR